MRSSGSDICSAEAAEFATQWARTQVSVRAYLISFLSERSTVEDCIQEVALLAWKKGPRGATAEEFLGFSLACAKRIGMSEIRKKYRNKVTTLSPDIVRSLSDVVAAMEQRDASQPVSRVEALQVCLGLLDPGQRALLDLRYSGNDPSSLQKEAAATGRSVDAIYKKLERLRTLLRDCVLKKSVSAE